jgi:hypothetical protein
MQSKKYMEKSSAARCTLDLRQKVSNVNQMVVENLSRHVEQAQHCGVTNRVEDIAPILPANNDIPVSKNRELLGKSRLLDSKPQAEVVNPNLTTSECVDYPYPQRVSQRLEKLSLELT